MSLELCELKRGRAGKLLLNVNNNQYQNLISVFELYRSKSGITIDEYTDTKLSSGFTCLIDSVHEIIKINNGDLSIHNELLNVLNKAKTDKINIIFLGE